MQEKHPKPHILVTGADGFVGRSLIPRLLEQGYPVRALTRHRQSLSHAPWADQVEIVEGDVLLPETLKAACQQIEIAFYLVHLMGLGNGYTALEVQAAGHFARAALEGGVRRIIYLGGIAPADPGLASHLRSRLETGAALRTAGVPVTELRTAIILGHGSLSFEMIRGLVESLPVILLPPWGSHRTQPIDIETVIVALLTLLEDEGTSGKVYEIGGPEIVSYNEMLACYARQRQKRPWMLPLPFPLPLRLLARITAWLSGVPAPITHALIEGLKNETRVFTPPEHAGLQRLPEISCAESLKKAISRTHPHFLWRHWERDCAPLRSLYTQGLLLRSACYPGKADALARLEAHWRKQNAWSIETRQENLLRVARSSPLGELWWEWKLLPEKDAFHIRQTLFLRPCGLLGRLLWPILSGWLWHFTGAPYF